MSQEQNVEIVKGAVQEFIATGELSVAFATDLIWDLSAFRGWPEQPVFHGHDGFAEFLSAWRAPYEDWSIALEQTVDAGGDEVVCWYSGGRLRGSGSDVRLQHGIVYTLENRQIRRARCT